MTAGRGAWAWLPALAAALLAAPNSHGADPVTTHDPDLILFLDDRGVERREGLERRFARAEPSAEPVIAPFDPAHEADCAWGSVIREADGRFRLWYCTLALGHAGGGPHEMARAGVWGRGTDYRFHPRSAADVPPTETMLGRYAESDDGLHWRRPRLGLVAHGGSGDDNVVLSGAAAARQTDDALANFDGWSVLRDDADPDPSRRYKAVAHWESVHVWDNHDVSGALGRPEADIARFRAARGEYLATSPDGLRWEGPLERIDSLPSGGGDRLVVVPDPKRGGWMAYVRAGGWAYPSLSRSRDLVHWSAPEEARRITPEALGMPAVECMIPFVHGDLDLGFVCGMDKAAGRFTVRLAARGTDGEWDLCDDGRSLIPAGPPGSHHASGAVPLHAAPIVVGERMLIFYNAFSRDPEHPSPHGTRSIGVALLRRDGFAGLAVEPGRAEGTLVTVPLPAGTTRLLANVARPGAAAGRTGALRAALVDEVGAEVPGYSFDESVPVTVDGTRVPLRWRAGERLPAAAAPWRLALRIAGDAVLHAVACELPGDTDGGR